MHRRKIFIYPSHCIFFFTIRYFIISLPAIRLIKLLNTFPQKIAEGAEALSPAVIANYAYDLAKSFNSFYQDTPILREADEALKAFRVQLCASVATALKNAMRILGIEVPERM